MKTGDIILSYTKFRLFKPTTWLAPFIRFFDKTHYTHCYVVVCNWGVQFANEAAGNGIIATDLEHTIKGKEFIVLRSKKEIIERDFAILANSFINISKYDYWGVMVVQLIYRICNVWIRKNNERTDVFFCTNYAAYLHNLKHWWKWSPSDFIKSDQFERIDQINN